MYSNRPYIIIPKFINQPTWGGTYIAEMKGWQDLNFLKEIKIGQSYELFSGSKLLISINDTKDPRLVPEIGSADSPATIEKNFNLVYKKDYINIADVVNENPNDKMPLLIKINQSKGNSFQLHVKKDVKDVRWTNKAESWYYFEPGLLTFGIKKGINLDDYKTCCIRIDEFMKKLSDDVKDGKINLGEARKNAKDFITIENPWQYVNRYETSRHEVIDQGLGGIHHSWEEDRDKYPLGNVLYEIQEDKMDPVSTIRAFDQGKIKDDGSIREVHIEDYFKYIDTNEMHNDINLMRQKREGNRLLTTPIYCMDILELKTDLDNETSDSFHHLFVSNGAIQIEASETKLFIHRGHSCFVPKNITKYKITPLVENSVVLKTYLTK